MPVNEVRVEMSVEGARVGGREELLLLARFPADLPEVPEVERMGEEGAGGLLSFQFQRTVSA